MWFAEQLNSFLDLGICKEYPNMTRSKSVSGSKANRTNPNLKQEQANPGGPASIPDVKAVAAQTPAEIVAEAKAAPGPRKLEAVKTEPRKNVVVPINRVPNNLEDEIRRRAYEIYLQRGPASGSEAEDWLTAEREIKQRYHQQSA
jgi:Protein of unknown function (DUF2934)